MGQHLDAATAPTAGLAWTFTGNEQAIVKVTVDEGALTQARWGALFRSDEKITSFSRGGYDDYFLDTGLELGQNYVYKLIAYTKNLTTGEIYASGPLYTPEIVAVRWAVTFPST